MGLLQNDARSDPLIRLLREGLDGFVEGFPPRNAVRKPGVVTPGESLRNSCHEVQLPRSRLRDNDVGVRVKRNFRFARHTTGIRPRPSCRGVSAIAGSLLVGLLTGVTLPQIGKDGLKARVIAKRLQFFVSFESMSVGETRVNQFA